MTNKFIIYICLISSLYITSCTSDQIEEPKNLIPESQMIEVLTDICKVEARFQRRLSIRGKDNSELVLHNYSVIFNDHNVSLTQFKTSFEYYEESPNTMQQIYDSVIVKLTKEEAELKQAEQKSNTK
jgi:hypothetical protein